MSAIVTFITIVKWIKRITPFIIHHRFIAIWAFTIALATESIVEYKNDDG
jgi:hypothetical protein